MKLKTGVWYDKEQIAAFRDDPELAGLALKGYVLQQDPLTGRMRFVHYTKAAKSQGEPGNTWGQDKEVLFDKREHLKPIQRRTPQERMASLMDKVGPDLREYLSAQKGEEVTGEDVKRVAADAMLSAEVEFTKKESKQVVRTEGSPYA